MAGEAEAARMGESLAVADQQIRCAVELFERGEGGRDLRKASRPGTYGKSATPCATAEATGRRVSAAKTTTAVATAPVSS